jgi:hypothetical protein
MSRTEKEMNIVTKTVNCTKSRPLKSRLAELCEKLWDEYRLLLVYCNPRWLSRGNVVAHGYNSREGVSAVLEEENLVHFQQLRSECFVSELNHIFEKFITLNTCMKGNGPNIIIVTEK